MCMYCLDIRYELELQHTLRFVQLFGRAIDAHKTPSSNSSQIPLTSIIRNSSTGLRKENKYLLMYS